MHWCECDRKQEDQMVKKGGPLRCSSCEGFLLCDFCGRETSEDIGFRNIAICVIGDHYTCQAHVWLAAARVLSLDADTL
jgi:hypothetical protein